MVIQVYKIMFNYQQFMLSHYYCNTVVISSCSNNFTLFQVFLDNEKCNIKQEIIIQTVTVNITKKLFKWLIQLFKYCFLFVFLRFVKMFLYQCKYSCCAVYHFAYYIFSKFIVLIKFFINIYSELVCVYLKKKKMCLNTFIIMR